MARAQGQLDAAQVRSETHALRVEAARMAALRAEVAAMATAQAWTWAEQTNATAQAHGAAAQATVQAQPTAAPDRVISRAAGRIVAINAEERDGVLVVTLEIVP